MFIIFSLIFLPPRPSMVAPQRLSSIEMQRILSKIAKTHDKLCQFFNKINFYSVPVVCPLSSLIILKFKTMCF